MRTIVLVRAQTLIEKIRHSMIMGGADIDQKCKIKCSYDFLKLVCFINATLTLYFSLLQSLLYAATNIYHNTEY